MNMENIENILPAIPEDFIDTFVLDGGWMPDKKYKPLMLVFYKREKRDTKDSKISRVQKKKLLSNILETQETILDVNFIMRLKKLLPEGLCYENICTDTEYESLKKEFNI